MGGSLKFLLSIVAGVIVGAAGVFLTLEWQEEKLIFSLSNPAEFGDIIYQNLRITNNGWDPATNVVLLVNSPAISASNVRATPPFETGNVEKGGLGKFERIRRNETVTVSFSHSGTPLVASSITVKSDRSVAAAIEDLGWQFDWNSLLIVISSFLALSTILIVIGTTLSRLIPLNKQSIDDTGKHTVDTAAKLTPIDTYLKAQPGVVADIKRYVDAGDHEGVLKKIERIADKNARVSSFKELAKIYMSRQDKSHSIAAVHKFADDEGETPAKYALLAYVYWWFSDVDTAIAHAERGLNVALSLNENAAKEDMILRFKNSLAYYYAQKGINKEKARSYILEVLKKTPLESENYIPRVHTQGYLLLQFDDTQEGMNTAIECFHKVLEKDPHNAFALQHLVEAYEKRRSRG